MPICRKLERELESRAESRTFPTTGMIIAAKMPIMAMTVSSSIRVKAALKDEGVLGGIELE